MKKFHLLILSGFLFTITGFAQPGAVGNNNISGAPFVCTPLTAPSFAFFQARIQANQSSSSATWEFPANCSYPGDVWRPYFGSGIIFNSTVMPDPGTGDGAVYNGGNGGASGALPATTNGNYYTFNIQNVSAPSNAYMAVLETNYNPVTISAVSNTTPANATNSVLVNCTVSSAPASGEYVYVRYSTNGYVTSALAQFTFTGTAGQALIPCFAGGTIVNYYVMSSNRTVAQINVEAGGVGQIAYDMLTLNLNNNGGPNYNYTQGSAANFGGVYSTPSTCYATVSAFVTALNGGTVTAPVTMYAIGGSATETATAGGIAITQTGTVANPIVVQKFGTGSYTIQASAALTVGNLNDAIIKLVGADYITIDGLTLQENASNTVNTPSGSNNMTEWGVSLLRVSSADGAQNNTIENNTITLNKTYRNTFGIYSNTRHIPTAPTSATEPTAVTGSNFGNKIYGNNISNVMMGITFIGASTAAFHDAGNDIGGSSAATGNTITNWGGNTPLSTYANNSGTSYCIFLNHQVGENVSYNTINSGTVGSGVGTTFSGIRKDYTVTAPTGTFTSTISHNTITMSSAFTGGNFDGIRSLGMTSLSTATINITNNNIVNSSVAAGSTSAFGGILNGSAPGTLNITNNIIRGHTTASSGGYTGISNSGAVVNTINITNNKIGDAIAGALTQTTATGSQVNVITNTGGASTATVNINDNAIDGFVIITSAQIIFIQNQAASAVAVNMNNNLLGSTTGTLITLAGAQSGGMFFILNGGSTATTTVSINGNDIRGVIHAVTGTGLHHYIRNNTTAFSLIVSNNTFTNLTANISGDAIFFLDVPAKVSGASAVINNNSIVTGYNKSAAGGTVYFLYSTAGSVSGSTSVVTNNSFTNVTLTGSTAMTVFRQEEGISITEGPAKTITGNTINNITGGSGTIIGMYLGNGGATNCSNNTFSNITGTGAITAISNNFNDSQGTVSYSNNTISNLSSTGTGGNVTGITGSFAFVPTTNINGNVITGFSSTGVTASVAGINLINGQTINIYDNSINNLSGSAGTSVITGIVFNGGQTANIYRNHIHTLLQTGAVSGSTPPVNGMIFSGGTTVTVYDNFVANLHASNANLSDAIRGISIDPFPVVSTYNLNFNSVYLNASSSGTNFGTSGIYHTTNATATTAALNMINNIIVNTSTANGTGVTAAYRRSDPTLTNYAATSDYNLLYAGTPSATRLIFYDGTNSDQTLAAYQTRVSTRDANSISLMPTFVSTTDLHLTTANCGIDGRGTPVAITTDIDNATRDVTTPDIGADEFTASYGPVLAGVAGSAVCDNKIVSAAGTNYATSVCDLIARVVPSGADPVAGKVNVCVTLDATQQYFNGEPYVQRHFDLEPTTSNQTTTSATITLYFTNAEFVLYNSNNPVQPPLPTNGAGNTVANRNNLKVTQFHGTATTTPSTPGNYTGVRVLITPGATNVFWNGTYWEVTFNVAGFSGFYVHTNNYNAPLPVVVNYLTGRKQGINHLLNWKVTCTSTPRATMTLERSSDARNYTGIYNIAADAARCQQPFDYTDADPLKGMNYYRLKIVDADGKVTYSTTVALLNAVKGFDIVGIAPNPVVGNNFKLNIASAQTGKMEISIFDMQGRLMNRQTLSLIAGYNSLPVNVANLSPGNYIIKGSMSDDQSKVVLLVKQ